MMTAPTRRPCAALLLLAWGLFAGAPAFAAGGPHTAPPGSPPGLAETLGEEEPIPASAPNLTLTIRCLADELRLGDEVPIEFTLTNRGAADFEYFELPADSYRWDELKLTATDARGAFLGDPCAGIRRTIEMLRSMKTLHPGESFRSTIALNRWCAVTAPGRYFVAGTYRPPVARGGVIGAAAAVASNHIAIDVAPRTDEETAAYVDKLSADLAATADRGQKDSLVRRLMYTRSPRILPAVLDSMYSQGGFWESEALVCFLPRTPEARRAILDAAAGRGLAREMLPVLGVYAVTGDELRPAIERSLAPDNPSAWASGAQAAAIFPNDAFTARLVAIATDPANLARKDAIRALAQNRTDESIKALRALLADSDEAIRKAATAAVRSAYAYRGKSIGRRMTDEDFGEEYRKP